MTVESPIARRLLDEFQRDFPLVPRPFAAIAERLGVDEDAVIERLADLRRAGVVARIGAVIEPNRLGASTLAAMAVPAARLAEIAELVSAYPEVNHNYEREHAFNLWFVVAAPTRARLDEVLTEIAATSSIEVLDLPLVEPFKLDLGFPLQWS
jgi:DNA-binding Lrp family transcriptional regulator